MPSKGGYHFKGDVLYNSKGQITNGVTEYIGGGKSNVFLSPTAFSSKKQLFLSMGHEYIHVTQNATLKAVQLQKTYRNFRLSEIAAYNWESTLGHNMAYGPWSRFLGAFQWRNNPNYNWLPRKFPF